MQQDFRDETLDEAIETLTARLLQRVVGGDRTPPHWEGRLSSSALATATAITALVLAERAGALSPGAAIETGVSWLTATQKADGGWGDTVRSRSNLSTTLLVWAALGACRGAHPSAEDAMARVEPFLRNEVGEVTPERLGAAILRRYGNDRTFSAPILAVLAMTGRLGPGADGWRLVPQLPFELAACPHRWFQLLRLPVVSYALPALIAIGQVRHHHRPTRNLALRAVRRALAGSTRDALTAMQPASGGYLEATPLTSFVVMSLISAGHARHPVAESGLRFLLTSRREDGGWPIDTNLATWVTTTAINAWGPEGVPAAVDRAGVRGWLLAQQHLVQHPFTHAAPGGWAWTDCSGGVPDADDTAGALLALAALGPDDARARDAGARGVRWLIDLQNRDGGIPTFCRGWGALPFDRSAPDLTAHALQAWGVWQRRLPAALAARVDRARRRAERFLVRAQRPDGAWVPLWFGNEHTRGEENPVYGTARVLAALAVPGPRESGVEAARGRGLEWLLNAQHGNGSWGGDAGAPASLEETGLALQALARLARLSGSDSRLMSAGCRAVQWLIAALAGPDEPVAAPIGLYFARLWYFEELYPLVFPLAGLMDARRTWAATARAVP
ncbi:MAG: prenyltransferase/squalene oxidase repeat-containing protein [Acidobacteriota bacterium]